MIICRFERFSIGFIIQLIKYHLFDDRLDNTSNDTMNGKIIALSVVAIVVIATVAVYVVASGNGNSDNIEVDASLAIMGNANGDATIDSEDLEIVDGIIRGELSFSDYPLADANNDGSVTEADSALIRSMIENESGITIYVICSNADGSNYIQGITYPLRNTVVVGTNLLSTVIQVGAAEYVCGYSKTNYGVAHGLIISNARDLGGSIFDLNTDASIANFQSLDAEVGIDAVITMPSASYLRTSESYITGAGIPVLRIDSSEGLDSIGGILTIGFLYGAETEEISYRFAEMCYEVLDYIIETVASVPDGERVSFMAITMGYYISEIDSAYTGVCEYAGGVTVSTLEGDGSTRIEEGSEYYLSWNPDYIISFRTLDYSIDYTDITTGTTLTPAETWNNYASYFQNMGESYENMIYINTSMPVICRIAYIAEIFYPDLFEEGFGDSVHQEFVDNFMSYLGDFDVTTDMTTVITYDDIFST